jgi:hypothetical protein
VELLTREELEARKLRILRLWDTFESVEQQDICCDSCAADIVWSMYGPDAADTWEELQEIRALLGERETPRWTY